MKPAPPQLVLASASPRRRELLSALGLRFTVRPVDLDETPLPGEDPAVYVERLAREKASAVTGSGELVLAADTTVVHEGEILGKPADAADAEATLARLAGQEHQVFTGVALWDADRRLLSSRVDRSRVRIAALSAEEVRWYVATGEPMDKAGSYGIQGCGALFVEAVDGNYTNVVGLPMPTVYRLFQDQRRQLLDFRG